MVDASPADLRLGLLGFISCTLGGRVRLGGLTLRRSKVGRLYVAFPKTRDAHGRVHENVRPLNAVARRDIEAQIFKALGIRLGAAP
jgi:DNA-binding cell septation regulator SpoVG